MSPIQERLRIIMCCLQQLATWLFNIEVNCHTTWRNAIANLHNWFNWFASERNELDCYISHSWSFQCYNQQQLPWLLMKKIEFITSAKLSWIGKCRTFDPSPKWYFLLHAASVAMVTYELIKLHAIELSWKYLLPNGFLWLYLTLLLIIRLNC